ncbi:MAG: class II glutamine amidotransferase [Bacillota bacterium]
MRDLDAINNPRGETKIIDSCGLFGMMSLEGRTFSGADVIRAMANMHDRGNGLGGGFAAYGIYPDFADYYALHVMFDSETGRDATEAYIDETCEVVRDEDIPTKPTAGIGPAPVLRRYFIIPRGGQCTLRGGQGEGRQASRNAPSSASASAADVAGVAGVSDATEEADERIIRLVMTINMQVPDAFVLSCGKNMGVFKGVGYPEDIGRFFRLDEYEGYLWTAHGRFPTNTQGWWGGAHPFSILDWTVVHNGEISSYGTNRAFLETQGYCCSLHTDTEVIAYAVDLLARRHRLPMWAMVKVLAPPFWSSIDRMDEAKRRLFTALRVTYPDLLMNGPFTVIIANRHMMVGLRDRAELRPLVAATSGDMLYLSSEEAPIRLINPHLDRVWVPRGGEPALGKVGAEDVVACTETGATQPELGPMAAARAAQPPGRDRQQLRELRVGAG